MISKRKILGSLIVSVLFFIFFGFTDVRALSAVNHPDESEMIKLSVNYSTSFDDDDDWFVDWFVFTPLETGSYKMTLNLYHEDDVAYCYLYDSSFNQLASDTDGSIGLSYTLQAGYKYFYQLRHSTHSRRTLTFKAEKELESLTILDPLGSTSFHTLFTETSYPLTVKAEPNADKNGVIWSVSDESVASIDQNGNITGLKEGSTQVLATSTFDSSVVGVRNVQFVQKWDFDFSQDKYKESGNGSKYYGYLDYDTYEFYNYTNSLKLKNFNHEFNTENALKLERTAKYSDTFSIRCIGDNTIASTYRSDDSKPGTIINSNYVRSYIYMDDENASLTIVDNGCNNGITSSTYYQIDGANGGTKPNKVTIHSNATGLMCKSYVQINNGVDLQIDAKIGARIESNSGTNSNITVYDQKSTIKIAGQDYGLVGNLNLNKSDYAEITANAISGDDHGIGLCGSVNIDTSDNLRNPVVTINGSSQAVLFKDVYDPSNPYFGDYAGVTSPSEHSFHDSTIIDSGTGSPAKAVSVGSVTIRAVDATITGDCDVGESVSITANEELGYTFTHWYVANNNGWVIDDGVYKANYSYLFTSESDINNPTVTVTVPEGRTKLEARYDTIQYGIQYNLNGGTLSGTNPSSYYVNSSDITLINPTKSGYVFTGWYDYDTGITSRAVVIPTGSTGDKKYIATWEKLTIQIGTDTTDMFTGKTYQLSHTISPSAYIDDTSVIWSSSNSSIATIGPSTGLLTAKEAGEVTITARNAETNNSVQTVITIYDMYDFATNSTNRGNLETDGFQWKVFDSFKTLTLKNFQLTRNNEYVIRIPTATTISYEGNNVLTSTYQSSDGTPGAIIDSGIDSDEGTSISISASANGATLVLNDEGVNNGISAVKAYLQPGQQYDSSQGGYFYPSSTMTINSNANGYYGRGRGDFFTGHGLELTINAKRGIADCSYVTVWYDGNLTIHAEDYGLKTTGNLYLRDTSQAYIEANAKEESDLGIAAIVPWVKDGYGSDGSLLSGRDAVRLVGSSAALKLTEFDQHSGLVTIVKPADYSVEDEILYDRLAGEPAHEVILGGNKYTITYNLNGGEVNGVNPTKYSKHTDYTLINPTREGYTFTGWTDSETAEPTETYHISSTLTGALSLTANWSVNSYPITYDLDGGSVSENPESYTVEMEDLVLNQPVKDFYEFAGWIVNNTGDPVMTGVIPSGNTGEMSFKAVWRPVDYTITYDYDGGSAEGNPASYTVETETFTVNAPEKTGYSFTGWVNEDNNPVETSTIETGSHGDLYFKAQYSPVDYTITYELDGGKLSKENPTSYTIESDSFALSDPDRNGYEFSGWVKNGQTNIGKNGVIIPHGSYGDMTLTATWTEIIVEPEDMWIEEEDASLIVGQTYQYTATFWPDNTTDQSIVWASSNESVATVNENGLVTAIGAGSAEISATSVANNSFVRSVNVTVRSISVSFDANGGNAIDPVYPNYYQSIARPDDPSKEFYTFSGWYLGDTPFDFNTLITDNIVLTAHWTPDEYHIIYSLEGGTADNPNTFTIETPSFILQNPVKSGYAFTGWTGSNGEVPQIEVTVTQGTTGDLSYQANWERLPDSVSFTKAAVSLEVNQSEKLYVTVLPVDAVNKTLIWTSADTGIAEVDQTGTVTGKSAGSTEITVETVNGKTDTCTITVNEKFVPVSRVKVSPSSLNLETGESKEITVTVNPSTATNKTILWQSSDTSVATVVNGIVTGVGAGTATITATSESDPSKTSSVVVTVTAKEPTAIILNSASLTLEGDIGVNFFISVPEEEVSDTKIVITHKGQEHSYNSSDARVDGSGRLFQLRVNAKEMNDEIRVFAEDNNGEKKTLKVDGGTYDYKDEGYLYSVAQYLNGAKNISDEKLASLASAMETYGINAQKYFGYGDYQTLVPSVDVSSVTVETLEPYKYSKNDTLPAGLTSNGCSLVLNTTTSIRVYFTVDSGHEITDYTFMVDNKTAEPVQKDNMYYVVVPNIAAKDLDVFHTVTASDGNTTYSISYCALSYCRSKLSNTSTSESLQNLVKSLYLYNQASKAYFSN